MGSTRQVILSKDAAALVDDEHFRGYFKTIEEAQKAYTLLIGELEGLTS